MAISMGKLIASSIKCSFFFSKKNYLRRSWNIMCFLSPWYLVSPQFGNTFLGSCWGTIYGTNDLQLLTPSTWTTLHLYDKGVQKPSAGHLSSGVWKCPPRRLSRENCAFFRGFGAFPKIFRYQSHVMWVKQCHKPPMTIGNGNHTTYKNGDDWGMV